MRQLLDRAPVKPRAALGAFVRLAEQWNLTRAESLVLLGVPERTYYRWRESADRAQLGPHVLERISHLVSIYANLHRIFGDGNAVANHWIRQPNAALGGQTPLERMLGGQTVDIIAVRTLVERGLLGV